MQTPPELPNITGLKSFELSMEIMVAILVAIAGFIWRSGVWAVNLILIPLRDRFIMQMEDATKSREKAVKGLHEVKEEITKTNSRLDELIRKGGV